MTGALIQKKGGWDLDTDTHREKTIRREPEETVTYKPRKETWNRCFPLAFKRNQPYHLPCFLLYKAFFYVAYSCVIVWLHIIRFYLARDKEPWTCRKSFMCLLVTYIFLDLPFKAKCCDWFSFKYPFVSWFKNAKGNNFIIVIGSRV